LTHVKKCSKLFVATAPERSLESPAVGEAEVGSAGEQPTKE